ncbi:hypothetical protein DYQ86_16660 [Acidobacteria bacterium AB60]|nr:hypothetical protein DYQ86_16660 [Acidobacteria bacterium AB60]
MSAKQFRRLALLALVFTLGTLAALAADVTGKWKGSVETPRGTQEISLDLHADGAALTGKITTPRGESDIQDGKIDGDNLSFTQVLNFNGNEFKINYTGKVEGDTIKFTRTVADHPAVEFTATREK